MATLQRDPATLSPIESWLHSLPEDVDKQEAVTVFLSSATASERHDMEYAWQSLWARPNQRLPVGEWDTWMIRAGRGYGKTRTGSEGVRRLVGAGAARAVTIIGSTAADARDVMIENPDSGLLAVHPSETRPLYTPSTRTLVWPNGAIGHVRSAEDPDSIRGLNSELVWGDEPASWRYGKAAWDNAMLGNRVGRPHSILTGTPRPLEWLREIEKAAGTVLATGSTYENIGNLADAFIRLILSRYEGTRLGMQELHAQYLADVEGALWRMSTIEAGRFDQWNREAPWQSLIVQTTLEKRAPLGLGTWLPARGDERRPWEIWVGVDPPAETAECGIIVATAPVNGRAGSDHCVVLDDRTVEGPPEVWGPAVVEAVRFWQAKGAVVERNQGGDMVRSTVHNVDPNVRVEKINSNESKFDRAEPVSVLYPQGWIHHYGHLAKLEVQQTTWVVNPPPGEPKSKSPDRLDALVHVINKLLKVTPTKGASSVYAPVQG